MPARTVTAGGDAIARLSRDDFGTNIGLQFVGHRRGRGAVAQTGGFGVGKLFARVVQNDLVKRHQIIEKDVHSDPPGKKGVPDV